jgi:hypothetical protein
MYELPERNRPHDAVDSLPVSGFAANQYLRSFEQDDREDQIKKLHLLPGMARQLGDLHATFEETSDQASRRIQVDSMLADRLLEIADDISTPLENAMALGRMATIAKKCHHSAVAGVRQDGGLLLLHDDKCSSTIFCPWAAREEAMRIAQWYEPEIFRLANEKPTHRVFYAVLTMNNFEPGRLAHGQKRMYNYIRHWLDDRFTPVELNPDYLPEHERPARCTRAQRRRYRAVKVDGAPFKAWPNIKAALCVMESPLSAKRDWNIHVNMILVVDGRFDFDFVRQTFGYNVHLAEVDKGDHEKLRGSLREMIKYSAMHAQMKAEAKPEELAGAPAMLNWSNAELLEFYRARLGFRRTRAYGLLHSIERKLWERSDKQQRLQWCTAAGVEKLYAAHGWACEEGDFGWEKVRNKIRAAMRDLDPVDLSTVVWVGHARYDRGRYRLDIPALRGRVDLIPEDNFSDFDPPNYGWRDPGRPPGPQ